MTRLYPICRSITGEGVRETLRIMQEQIPLEIREVPTGTQVFDWSVPKAWNIRDAWIKNSAGKRLVDFRQLDRAFTHVLKRSRDAHRIIDFSPYGYDERQYCSPGFNLPVGVMMRSRHGEFPEYHTSADNLSFVRPEALRDSLAKIRDVIEVLEHNRSYVNLSPKGEPQLGRRGLYGMVGGENKKDWEMAVLWVLNLSDGNSNLLDIAERSGLPFPLIRRATEASRTNGKVCVEGGS